MSDWTITLLIGAVQFAATFGGVVAALKYQGFAIARAQKTGDNAHARLDHHLEFHAQQRSAS